MASLGGAWLALVAGFGGFRDHGGIPAFDPALPEGLTRLCFSLRWRGLRLTVDVHTEQVTYSVRDGDGDVAEPAPRRRGHRAARRRTRHPRPGQAGAAAASPAGAGRPGAGVRPRRVRSGRHRALTGQRRPVPGPGATERAGRPRRTVSRGHPTSRACRPVGGRDRADSGPRAGTDPRPGGAASVVTPVRARRRRYGDGLRPHSVQRVGRGVRSTRSARPPVRESRRRTAGRDLTGTGVVGVAEPVAHRLAVGDRAARGRRLRGGGPRAGTTSRPRPGPAVGAGDPSAANRRPDAARGRPLLLSWASPQDTVTALPHGRIAGRDASGARVSSGEPGSSVRSLDVWVDTSSGLPLEVDVRARADADPVLTTRFLDLSSQRPTTGTSRRRSSASAHWSVDRPDVLSFVRTAGDSPLPDVGARAAAVAAGTAGSPGRDRDVRDGLRAGSRCCRSPTGSCPAIEASVPGVTVDVGSGRAAVLRSRLVQVALLEPADGRGYLLAGTLTATAMDAAVRDAPRPAWPGRHA